MNADGATKNSQIGCNRLLKKSFRLDKYLLTKMTGIGSLLTMLAFTVVPFISLTFICVAGRKVRRNKMNSRNEVTINQNSILDNEINYHCLLHSRLLLRCVAHLQLIHQRLPKSCIL